MLLFSSAPISAKLKIIIKFEFSGTSLEKDCNRGHWVTIIYFIILFRNAWVILIQLDGPQETKRQDRTEQHGKPNV